MASSGPSKYGIVVPEDVFRRFFHSSATKLSTHEPQLEHKDGELLTLADHRRELLSLQRSCLVDVLMEHNDDKSSSSAAEGNVSLEEAQEALRMLGTSHGTEESPSDLIEAMEAMNEAARLAFARSVVRTEWSFDTTKEEEQPMRVLKKKRDGPFQQADILEFCALSNAAVQLREVQAYLQTGVLVTSKTAENGGEDNHNEKGKIPHERMERLHNLLLRAVGYEPKYATEEIKRIFFTPKPGGTTKDDAEVVELKHKFDIFLSNMTTAVANANIGGASQLSDKDSGGVTRVVSVSLSEKVVDESGVEHGAGGAPSETMMEQQDVARQQEQLKMARQAAEMQQTILGKLLSMEEDERDAALGEAKLAHETFLKSAMDVPPGPERVAFLGSVDPATQELLVMHKLWENMLAQNGGVPPTMRNKR